MNRIKVYIFSVLLFFLPSILLSQNKNTINNKNEKIIEDVKKYANKAADYIGELFRIQGPAPKNYIKASKITFVSEEELKSIVKIKNVGPEYQLKLLYPRIQYGKLQDAVYNSIVNHKSNNDKYSIVKFDNTSSVIVSSNNIDEISNNFKRNVGLEGFGGGTGIEDAILHSINLLISDSTSKSKLIVLFTDGETNSKLSQLTLDEIIKKALENNINIITVGYGTLTYFPGASELSFSECFLLIQN